MTEKREFVLAYREGPFWSRTISKISAKINVASMLSCAFHPKRREFEGSLLEQTLVNGNRLGATGYLYTKEFGPTRQNGFLSNHQCSLDHLLAWYFLLTLEGLSFQEKVLRVIEELTAYKPPKRIITIAYEVDELATLNQKVLFEDYLSQRYPEAEILTFHYPWLEDFKSEYANDPETVILADLSSRGFLGERFFTHELWQAPAQLVPLLFVTRSLSYVIHRFQKFSPTDSDVSSMASWLSQQRIISEIASRNRR